MGANQSKQESPIIETARAETALKTAQEGLGGKHTQPTGGSAKSTTPESGPSELIQPPEAQVTLTADTTGETVNNCGEAKTATIFAVDITDRRKAIQNAFIESDIYRRASRLQSSEAYLYQMTSEVGRSIDYNYQATACKSGLSDRDLSALREKLAKIGKYAGSSASPIFEEIKSLILQVRTKYPDLSIKLVVYSDLLQNSRGYSQLKRSTSNISLFRESNFFAQNRVDLRGVSVDIVYLTSPLYFKFQGEVHRNFWERVLLDEMGANTVRFIFG
jgi:hypothetical protein